jgi:cytochrome c oxidase cbb3-type subunit III
VCKRVIFALLLVACHREQRSLIPTALDARRASVTLNNPYEGNAYAVSQGQQLFEQYNCSGCHFHGGGGIGPALMDDEWIYGSSPANIYSSIAEGRPNGMPSWGGRIPDFQIWQLVTYVRAVGGFEGRVIPGARADEMQARKAEEH